MMLWSVFKKKIEGWYTKNQDQNIHVNELEKIAFKGQIAWMLYFALFFFSAFMVFIVCFALNALIGFAILGMFAAFMVILFTVLIETQKIYVFLRKAYEMYEEEDFEKR